MKTICSRPGCLAITHARGLCSRHYWKAKGQGEFPVADIRRQDPLTRFNAKWVLGSPPEHYPELGPCHLWTGSKSGKGYGQLRRDGRTRPAHTWAWEDKYGPLPPKTKLDHRCHEHSCVNVDHLRIVSSSENQQNRRGAQAGSVSKYRGVYWDKNRKKWAATVTSFGKTYYVGRFENEAEAAEAARRKRLEVMTCNDLDRRGADVESPGLDSEAG